MAEIKKSRAKKPVGGADDSLIVEMPATLDISSVASFCDKLKESYLGKDISFDASKVEKFTTPAVQLLASVAITAKARGGVMNVSEPSDAFKKSITDLGFSNQLKEWMGENV